MSIDCIFQLSELYCLSPFQFKWINLAVVPTVGQTTLTAVNRTFILARFLVALLATVSWH